MPFISYNSNRERKEENASFLLLDWANLIYIVVQSLSCVLILCDPMDCSMPGVYPGLAKTVLAYPFTLFFYFN